MQGGLTTVSVQSFVTSDPSTTGQHKTPGFAGLSKGNIKRCKFISENTKLRTHYWEHITQCSAHLGCQQHICLKLYETI